jgi:undecaprenyl-phosphate 4-deoxy-4-formamido-L-arabinose transferase
VGVALGVYVVLEKLENPKLPIGYPSLITTLLLFSGVQLLMLGMIGEYVGRLFLSMNNTPQFVVREVVRGGRDNG